MRPIVQRNVAVVLLVVELIFIVVFATCSKYDEIVTPQYHRHSTEATDSEPIRQYYGMFQDVHVMVVIGFGFLMVFLRKYGYSSVGFTLLMTAVIIQWTMIFQGLFNMDPSDGKVHLSVNSMLDADVATAAVLISMGAVLGRTTPVQLIVMGILEIILYSVNVQLCTSQIQSADLGGSMLVHVFGAYFGLAVSRVLGPPPKQHDDESSMYTSDILAMIGTTFLWVFWPSFNGVLASGHAQHRAVLNTYLALAASCVTAVAGSALFGVGSSDSSVGKFKMVHVQNATLAGGVAVGAVADLMLSPAGALIVGAIAGLLSVIGYAHLQMALGFSGKLHGFFSPLPEPFLKFRAQPFLLKHFHLHDTCGVHNLHGMPGIASGIISVVMAAIADDDTYRHSLYQIYPARAPTVNSTRLAVLLKDIYVDAGSDRNGSTQAGYQVIALASSLGFGLLGGAITGVVLRDGRIFRQVSWQDMFRDSLHWEVAEDSSIVVTGPSESAISKTPVRAAQLPVGSGDAGNERKPVKPPALSTVPTTSKSPVIPGALQKQNIS